MTIVIAMNTIININIVVLLPIIIKSNSTFFGRSNLLLKRQKLDAIYIKCSRVELEIPCTTKSTITILVQLLQLV